MRYEPTSVRFDSPLELKATKVHPETHDGGSSIASIISSRVLTFQIRRVPYYNDAIRSPSGDQASHALTSVLVA